ncbi:signal recognition particle protein, partial [Psychromonas arctica]
TTSVDKLSLLFKNKVKKSVLVGSADIYRAAAIKQLETLAAEVAVEFFPSDISQKPIDIANAAITHAKKKF